MTARIISIEFEEDEPKGLYDPHKWHVGSIRKWLKKFGMRYDPSKARGHDEGVSYYPKGMPDYMYSPFIPPHAPETYELELGKTGVTLILTVKRD